MLNGKANPVMAWGTRPMLPHVMRQSTDDSPNRELQARCRAMEQQGAIAATLFVGFPHADIPGAGIRSCRSRCRARRRANSWCKELLDQRGTMENTFVYRIEPFKEPSRRKRRPLGRWSC